MPWVKIEVGATRRKRGRRVKVGGATVVIGRGESCTIRVNDDQVSRRHAALVLTERGWIVQDLCAANGTLLNDRRITTAELRARDVLRLGEGGPKVHVIELDPPGVARKPELEETDAAPDESLLQTRHVRVEENDRGPTPAAPVAVGAPQLTPEPAGDVGAPWVLLFGLSAGVLTGLEAWPAAFPYREVAAPAVWLSHLVGNFAPALLATKAAWLVAIALGLYCGLWGLGCQRITKRWPILVLLALIHAGAYFALPKLGA